MSELTFNERMKIFYTRWVVNSFLIAILVILFGEIRGGHPMSTFLIAGLIFSIVNSLLRPIIMILSLPAILLTLGFFTLVVNGFIVWFSLLLAPNIKMSFINAIISGMVLSLINYKISDKIERV